MSDAVSRARTALAAVGVGLAGFLGGAVGVSLASELVAATVGSVGALYEQWVFVTGFGVGAVATVGLYLSASDRGVDDVDLGWPTRRDLQTTAVGLVAIFVLFGVVTAGRTALGLDASPSQVQQALEATPDPIAVVGLAVLSLLVVGPTEELLFRNIVQKRLREAFSAPRAIAIASLFFAGLHAGQYGSGTALATVVSLATVFALATILGAVYEYSGRLIVPAAVHGLFNAIQILGAWAVLG
ncbi:MAG: CPBP family intramembrane glutamic endopeptidase [Halococcoides sp.]